MMNLRTEFDILGLFQASASAFRSESAPAQMPNMIWLYRRPILDYWASTDETLGALITHVLVHRLDIISECPMMIWKRSNARRMRGRK